MGGYFVQTFGKCMAGLADAALRGREPSPTTQEICAVAMREMKKLGEEQKGHQIKPIDWRELMPPPKPRAHLLFKQVSPAPKATISKHKDLANLLKTLTPEQRELFLKSLSPEARQ